jgi:membrane protease subunit HflC
MRRIVIGLFTFLVVFVLFVVLCTFVRRPYETVLINRFGNLIGEQEQVRLMYNWYFKLPTDRVERIDTRLHLYSSPLLQVTTAGREPISIRTFAAWHIVDPMKFYRTTGGSDQRAKEIMETKLQGLVQGKLAAHSLDELFNTDENKVHTDQIEKEVSRDATGSREQMAATGKSGGLLDQGLEIVEVGFSRMAFPPQNADAVYMRMVAELNRQARAYESEGRSQVAQLTAEGDQQAAKIRAESTAKAEQIRGEADREALGILAGVQETPAAREFYQYWKSLDYAKNSLTKNTILVLSSDSDWLKALFQVPRSNQFTPPASNNAPSQGQTGAARPGSAVEAAAAGGGK